ncbi:hypothetical protein CEUSTIGMA_g2291.t1 [Chlamydomonas eustigma]|uniref:DNA-directed primase/polymerase protein n=1 Tax=Chlamydomonas eustigma TaxID=1157962 RepID=A0A250WVM1_9CHLO|nr:hypothetical protein CEUSTIGMA_g2291.t1 [Chlamydomonas eustigma]|eukprot:GAX74845.1 hypothetical protein CEUSTIGMA_g2291.t1 [Chlamydomonas eustigma]
MGMKRPYHVSNATNTENENAAPNHVLPSIFPKLDSFIEAACTQGGLQGLIRCWAIQGDTVMYSMKNNRWCGNIGGAHKSNGIYYVVDLRKGLWHQRCYDPHCRLYKSSAMPLPHEVWSAYKLET